MAIYKAGIKIQGKPGDAYFDEVKKWMEAIGANAVGLLLFKHLKAEKYYVTISPYTADDTKSNGECNAVTGATDDDDAAPPGVDYYVHRKSTGRHEHSGNKGTGKGSDSALHYTPGMFGTDGCFKGKFGFQPDEVLLHELIHALREMQGLENPVPTEGAAGDYLDQEEFLAIVVTNVYISAKCNCNTGLTASHVVPPTELAKKLRTSKGFLSDAANRGLMNQIYFDKKAQPLFRDLATVPAPFNPFQEFQETLPKSSN